MITDRERAHSPGEIGPGETKRRLAEERIRDGGGGRGGGAIVLEEADLEVLGRWEGGRGGVGEELKCHRGGVVGDPDPIAPQRGEVCRTEEGLELRVRAQLERDERAAALGGNGLVQGGEDLRGEGCAGDGADGGADVVGEGELVGVG